MKAYIKLQTFLCSVVTLKVLSCLDKSLYRHACRAPTGVGQNNGKTTDIVHISLLIWCWTTFCFQYSFNTAWNVFVLRSFKQSLAEFYTILLQEGPKVALEMLEVGTCSSP
jgi:hypothetical protein